MTEKPKKQVKPAVAVEPAAPTPPERPAAKASDEVKMLGRLAQACPVCGSAFDGKLCAVDGYRGEA